MLPPSPLFWDLASCVVAALWEWLLRGSEAIVVATIFCTLFLCDPVPNPRPRSYFFACLGTRCFHAVLASKRGVGWLVGDSCCALHLHYWTKNWVHNKCLPPPPPRSCNPAATGCRSKKRWKWLWPTGLTECTYLPAAFLDRCSPPSATVCDFKVFVVVAHHPPAPPCAAAPLGRYDDRVAMSPLSSIRVLRQQVLL